MENALGIDALVSVRSEIIALGLNEIRRHPRAAISIQITERTHQTGHWNSELARRANEAAQVFLMIHNLVRDVWVEEQIGKIAPGLERGADVFQQGCANNATAPPDASNRFEVQMILVLDRSCGQQSHSLCISNDHPRIERTSQFTNKLETITFTMSERPVKNAGGFLTFVLVAR